MENDRLPDDNDVIVLGTGMTESIIAAALSRTGLKVLHLDRDDTYGGCWASFNFVAVREWIAQCKNSIDTAASAAAFNGSVLDDGENMILMPTVSTAVSNLEEFFEGNLEENIVSEHTSECKNPGGTDAKEVILEESVQSEISNPDQTENVAPVNTEEEKQVSASTEDKSKELVCEEVPGDACVQIPNKDTPSEGSNEEKVIEELKALSVLDVNKEWRKFSIDLMPKILYSRGALVELLISSDVARYCEFRSITRVLTLLNGQFEKVPCSRADVFASNSVGVIEKRMLMKFLTFSMEFQKHTNQYEGFETRTFVEFLKSKNLTETIRHYVQHAIAMVTDTATTLEGLEATQKFLLSLGRYGNTAFLWPLYGSGELLQCFCRMCAVFGGTYCLRRTAVATVVDSSNSVVGIIDSESQKIKTKWLVMEASYAPVQLLADPVTPSRRISRAVLITDGSIRTEKEQHITVMSLPLPNRTDSRVTVYELSSLSMACPAKFHLVHLTCRGYADAKTDLSPIVEQLFRSSDAENTEDKRPRILWSLYFNMHDRNTDDLTSSVKNVIIVPGPDHALDCDLSVEKAKKVFETICPGEEFLPKAPNPEDIIYDDGETSEPRESGFESIPEEVSDAKLSSEDEMTSEVDQSETSDIEQSKTSEEEQSETSEVKQLKTSKVDQSETSEVDQSETSEVDQS